MPNEIADIPWLYRAKTTFHVDGQERESFVDGLLPLSIGAGVIWENSKRYRVADSWFSFDHHGVIHTGWHVFLELCAPDDDLPKKLHPDYYVSDNVV